MHEYRARGKIKSVGVSNFGVKHLEILEKSCPNLPIPVCNQIECTPLLQETEIIDYCTKKGILIESYSPIGQAKEKVRNNATVKNKTPARTRGVTLSTLTHGYQHLFLLLR